MTNGRSTSRARAVAPSLSRVGALTRHELRVTRTDPGAIARAAVEADEGELGARERRLDQIEQAGPLREDQRLVILGDRRLERIEQRLDF